MFLFLFSSFLLMDSFAQDIKQVESDSLKNSLNQIAQNTHKPITYKQANEILFTKIDNHNGSVCSVYSLKNCLVTQAVPSPKIMNIEHTCPLSEGANGDAKSDLHQIFSVESSVNSIRSSLPFCEVLAVRWEKNQSKRGFSQFNEHCFEPSPEHLGNVARALFYFSIRYKKPIDENQESFLRKWHKVDPVDQNEADRNLAIKEFQNNVNPFIDDPNLVDNIIDF